jgi:hypothetical protein
MLPKQGNGYLYFDNTQPQRFGGYNHLYSDFTHNSLVCNIDSLATSFTNSKGGNSEVWLWKGDYNMIFNGGWHTGAEVGAYTGGQADDSILSSVSFTLSDSSGKIFDRHVDGQYWVNRFEKKIGSGLPSGLRLTATLTFKNGADARAYADAFNGKGNTYDSSATGDGTDRPYSDVQAKAEWIKDTNTVMVEFQ